jgi:hypothetical protein
MARGGHGLPKVSLGPAMPDLYMPCEQAVPETAVGQMAASGVTYLQDERPAAVFYPFRHPTPYAYDHQPNHGILLQMFEGLDDTIIMNEPSVLYDMATIRRLDLLRTLLFFLCKRLFFPQDKVKAIVIKIGGL